MQTIRRLIASVIAVTAVACASASGNRIVQTLPASIDPARIEVVEMATDKGEVLLRGTVSGAEGVTDGTRRGELTSLTGAAASGAATIRGDEILVQAIDLPALAFMTLRVNGEQAVFFRTTSEGRAEIQLERTTVARSPVK
jgi:hypothetical protein